jgi:hypothetical protein
LHGFTDGAGDRADGGEVDRLRSKAVSVDDAVVEDVGDVGLGGEAAEGGRVVLLGGGLDSGDAEVLVAPGETGAGRGDASFCVAGDGGVAIEDEVVVRGNAGGIDLGACETDEDKPQDDGLVKGEASEETCGSDGRVRSTEGWTKG